MSMHPTEEQLQTFRVGQKCDPETLRTNQMWADVDGWTKNMIHGSPIESQVGKNILFATGLLSSVA